ncbi:hypothetical protein MASR1M31_03290 [Porphyromonadaceae bacterium]
MKTKCTHCSNRSEDDCSYFFMECGNALLLCEIDDFSYFEPIKDISENEDELFDFSGSLL